jgi:hypothetical protein
MSDKEYVSACNCKGKCRCDRVPIKTPDQKKQAFIEWLEKQSAETKTATDRWDLGYWSCLQDVIEKAKEML